MAFRIQPSAYPYVPGYIPGELLYAWASRLHVLNKLPNPRSTLQFLFGQKSSILSADLPCGLEHFISQAKNWGPFSTCDEIANQATLSPYFGRFMSSERRQWLLSAMRGQSGIGLTSALGLLANGFGATVQLKGCNICDDECEKVFGCKTWFRVHQLPGVLMCPIHACSLHLHIVQSVQANRHSLHVPSPSLRENTNVRYGLGVQRFATLSSQALLSGVAPLNEQQRVQRYYAGIAKLGLGEERHIAWEALAQLVGDHYDWFSGMYCRDRLLSSAQQPLRWLRDLCQRPGINMHPICHILLAGFLYGDLNDFFAEEKEASAAELSNNAERPHSITFDLDKERELDRLLCDQKLSCREVARRVGKAVNCIVSKRRALGLSVKLRRKLLTNRVEIEIIGLAREGHSVTSISKLKRLSISTIYRTLAAHGERIRQVLEQDRRRQEWLELITLHPTAGTTSLRVARPSVYAWLYRHDRAWLVGHCPHHALHSGHGVRRIDWADRDAHFSVCIRNTAELAFREPDRIRVSVTFLLRSTGHETMIRHNFEKFPAVQFALRECAESDTSFRARRRREAERTLLDEGNIAPLEWEIIRRSRIRASAK